MGLWGKTMEGGERKGMGGDGGGLWGLWSKEQEGNCIVLKRKWLEEGRGKKRKIVKDRRRMVDGD